MELSQEDVLRLNVLLASKPQAIRIDESSMTVNALSDRGEAKVRLNPSGRSDQYLRRVREMLSGHVLGSPGGYPVYLQRWTRMGQMRDGSLEHLLLLGEPEAVVAVVCAAGLTEELARRAWWAMPDAENARRMLANAEIARSALGKTLAEYLIDYLPFETEQEVMIESVRLVLQPGLASEHAIESLWRKAHRKNAYYVGFMAAIPDGLPEDGAERPDRESHRAVLEELASSGNAVAVLLLRTLGASGQSYLATAARVLEKPGTQGVITEALVVVARYFSDMRPEGLPDEPLESLVAEADRYCTGGGAEPAVRACLEELPALLPEIRAMRILSGLGYGVLRPVLRDTTAIGSLMRRKLEPVLKPLIEQVTLLMTGPARN